MKDFESVTYNVGQGLFNLFLGTKNDDTPYCGVFDCGNFNLSAYNTCLQEACDKVDSFPGIQHINVAVISHQDIDHWRNFLEFMLKLNGYTSDNVNWYKTIKNGTEVFFSFIGDALSQELILSETVGPGIAEKTVTKYADYTVTYFSNNITANGHSCLSSDPAKSYWYIVFIPNENTSNRITFEIWYIPEINMYEIQLMFSDVPNCHAQRDQIVRIIIDIIDKYVTDPMFKSEIYNSLGNFYKYVFFNYADIVGIVENAYPINRRIENLYLGGSACSASYNAFKNNIKNFANSVYENKNYVAMSGDHPAVRMNPILFETDILNHKGAESFTLGEVYRNATSQITVLRVSTNEFILFPGDATVHTFTSIQNSLATQFAGHSMFLFVAPHHGSYKTNFSYERSPSGIIAPKENQPIRNLLTAFPPTIIAISSEHKKFGHPSEMFMNTMELHSPNTTEAPHFIGRGDSLKTSNFYPYQTTKRIYLTECSGNLQFHPNPTSLNSDKDLRDMTLPDNDLFISYKGFKL